MPITDSRLKTGTLTLDGVAFASQVTNLTLTPDTDSDNEEALEVLSGETLDGDASETTTWALTATVIQDFDDPAGIVNFAMSEAGNEVPFVWEPNATGPSYGGVVRVRPIEIGGDVASRLTTDIEWPVVGVPTPTYAP
jgi:hypothetical protein